MCWQCASVVVYIMKATGFASAVFSVHEYKSVFNVPYESRYWLAGWRIVFPKMESVAVWLLRGRQFRFLFGF